MTLNERIQAALDLIQLRIDNGGEWPDAAIEASEKFGLTYETIREAYDC